MTLLNETDLQSFVLLRLGDRRFAVTATQIAELVAPSRVFRFPHHTGEVEGVILRRGRIVPVVKPDGFLTPEELFLLDASLSQEADAKRAAERIAEDEQDASITQ